MSVLGSVCPLDHVKCCCEITSCSESRSVLNLLTRGAPFESLMGNIKYHCRPWNDALRGADVRSSRLRGQQGVRASSQGRGRLVPQGRQASGWSVGGAVLGVFWPL